MRQTSAPDGFTLLEVIIVIFIIALGSSVILFRLNLLTPSRSAERFSKQLYSYLNVVREQAILQPAVLGIVFSREGYSVLTLQQAVPASWVPMKRRTRIWQPTAMSSDLNLSLMVDNKPVNVPMKLSQINLPQIYFMPSGEISSFDLYLQQRKQSSVYHLQGTVAGDITLEKMVKKNGQ